MLEYFESACSEFGLLPCKWDRPSDWEVDWEAHLSQHQFQELWCCFVLCCGMPPHKMDAWVFPIVSVRKHNWAHPSQPSSAFFPWLLLEQRHQYSLMCNRLVIWVGRPILPSTSCKSLHVDVALLCNAICLNCVSLSVSVCIGRARSSLQSCSPSAGYFHEIVYRSLQQGFSGCSNLMVQN